MIIGNVRSHADLARKKQMQKDLLALEVSNEAELERRVKDFKNPYTPKAVPPKFKTRAELMRDVMELSKSLIDKFRDIDVPYEIARRAIQDFNNDPDSLIRFNALFPAIRRKLLEATIPSLITSEQILDVVKPILRRTDLAYGFALDNATIKTPQELSLNYGIEKELELLKNAVLKSRELIQSPQGKAMCTETATAIELLTEAYPDTEFFELLESPDITEEENHRYLEKIERAFVASSIPNQERTTQLIAELDSTKDGSDKDKIKSLSLVRRAVSNATPEKVARLKAVVEDIKKEVEASRRDKEQKNREDDDLELARNSGIVEGDNLLGSAGRERKSLAQRELEQRRRDYLDENSRVLTKDQRNLLRAIEIKLDEVIDEVGYDEDKVAKRLKEVTDAKTNPDMAQLERRIGNREEYQQILPYIDDMVIKRGVVKGGLKQDAKPLEFAEEVKPPRFFRYEVEPENLVRPEPPFINNSRSKIGFLQVDRDEAQRGLADFGKRAIALNKAEQDERKARQDQSEASRKKQYNEALDKIPALQEAGKRAKDKDAENQRFADLATQDLFNTLGDSTFPKLNKEEKKIFLDVFGSKDKDEEYKVGVAREYQLLKAESQRKVDVALDVAEEVEVWNADLVADAKQPSMPVSEAQVMAEEATREMVKALASGRRERITQIIAEEKEELDGERFESKVDEKPIEQVDRVARNIRRDEERRAEASPPPRPPPPPPRGAKVATKKLSGATLEDHEEIMEAQLQNVIKAKLPENLTPAQRSQIDGSREYFNTVFIQELTARPEEEQNALLRNIVIKIQTDTGKEFDRFLPPLKIFDRSLTEDEREKVFAGLERYYVARKVSEDFRYKPNVRGQRTIGRNSSNVEPLKKGIGMQKKKMKEESDSDSDDEMKKPIAHTKAFKASRIKVGKGIEVQEEPRYRTFGKYVVHMPQLRSNNLNFKYPKSLGTVPHLKSTPVSGEYRDFIIDVLDTGRMSEKELRRLPEHEQKHFEKVVVGCGLVETFKLNKTTSKDEKTDADRFNLLRGEYLAGNNAPTLLKELRSFILKFMDDGRIKRKEGMGLLAELAVSI
jgi:hypothetical protein